MWGEGACGSRSPQTNSEPLQTVSNIHCLSHALVLLTALEGWVGTTGSFSSDLLSGNLVHSQPPAIQQMQSSLATKVGHCREQDEEDFT